MAGKGKPGRPKGQRNVGSGPIPGRATGDGAQDAAAARAGLEEQLARGKASRSTVAPAGPGFEPLSPDEIQGAGLMIQDAFKMVATVRGPHWDIIPDDMVPRAGRPAALILRKYGPYAERYPEIALALVLLPPFFGALKVEYDIARAKAQLRRAAARGPGGIVAPAGVERGSAGPQGSGENLSDTVVVGTPWSLPDR